MAFFLAIALILILFAGFAWAVAVVEDRHAHRWVEGTTEEEEG